MPEVQILKNTFTDIFSAIKRVEKYPHFEIMEHVTYYVLLNTINNIEMFRRRQTVVVIVCKSGSVA